MGELCALMGPSGAGKTSLLNVLAGRIRTNRRQRVDGDITLDGQPITGANLRKRVAYVMQQDILCPTQTVRESLMFSANLRLPRSFSAKEKGGMVDQMITELGLAHLAAKCANTYIGRPAARERGSVCPLSELAGDDLIRGISGGEKKRTCVAIELIVQPKLVFLDEPTTGLDSFAAQTVIQKLRTLSSREGCNVLCTIHQPSSEVFHLFNKVMLIHSGAGQPCPAEYNLADHVMFLLQRESESSLQLIQSSFTSKSQESEDDEPVTTVTRLPRTRVLGLGGSVGVEGGIGEKSRIIAKGKTAGFCWQLWALTKREAQGVWRNVPGLIASLVMPALLNVLFALIFFQVGDVTASGYTAMAHFGGLFQVAIGGIFGIAQPLLLRFPLDRGIFLREYATQTYGAVPYFLSKTLVELPQSLLNATISWASTYWIMGLHGNFLFFVLIFWLTGTAAASTALLVGSLATNAEAAFIVALHGCGVVGL
ncbi:ABCG11 [Symbiodinium natans]|uniref:ABCG11 protein n=1 Tax=Symbiodinium natans TaxID=878477 RepID=A0A812IEU4_9DINO|nr:ABCG11 [Symbiodinium natans]